MPEHLKSLSNLKKDYYKESKPLLDEIQIDEFERKMLFAMEYAKPIRIKIWRSGFFSEYKGLLQRLDEINRNIYLKKENGEIVRISFEEIVGTEVDDR
jgi:hypothetical protein